MKKAVLLPLVLLTQVVYSQYRYDNVAFHTVYWNALCQSLQQHPGYLLLDVRSRGEFNDTSSVKSLNIGHLDGAVNIDINEIRSRLTEIAGYKNKPVYVYCSHSQRSRRVSKMLADSGFTQVYNINGGLSNLRLYNFKEDCHRLSTNLAYAILSPLELAKAKPAAYFILDVRTDSAFRGLASPERRNVYGKFSNAVNIPLAFLEQAAATLPTNKTILLVDETGNESPVAADVLAKKGLKNLVVLFNGLDGYLAEVPEKDRNNWASHVSYHAVSAPEFDRLAKQAMPVLLDVRKAEEFSNNSKESFRNIGNLKGAVNIPFTEWDKQFASLSLDKRKPVVVYAMSSQNEVFEAAKKLTEQGFTNVSVLMGGLFNLRWRAANVDGFEYLKGWVVNVPPDNQ